ncbi:MAG: chitin deacetylase [Alphaproteobacteria bacterium]|nr:MAG: chitin deacetylase [Alphaproteobacteria bacterium]
MLKHFKNLGRAARSLKGAMVALGTVAGLLPGAAIADQSAVILLYHRFGEDDIPSTNIRIEQLEGQIEQLKAGGYSFLSLGEIVRRLKAREDLPSRTITITVDDAYKSIATNGWPRLRATGIPMTLFVSTEPVDSGSSNYMSWDDVRRLKAEGVEIGHHTATHLHMPHAGLDAAMADVKTASARFEAELGSVPELFAYPYGEYDLPTRNAIEAAGFKAAFAQVSGAAGQMDDPYSLPRFPVNEHYGDLPRFKLISQAIALPISDIAPLDPVVDEAHNPPLFGFTVDDGVKGLAALTCYPSHIGAPANLIRLDETRFEVRFDKPFPKGRNRINCTMPAGKGRWYWYGKFFLVPGGVLD